MKIKFKKGFEYKIITRQLENNYYVYRVDGNPITARQAYQILKEYLEWYKDNYKVECVKQGWVVVRANSTSGPWIIEKSTKKQVSESIAEIYGFWCGKTHAKHIANILNWVDEIEKIINPT